MAILFVTKDLLFSSQIVGQAKARGMAIELALGADELVRKLSTEGGDVVVLDLAMPEIDPVELVARLNTTPNPPRAILAFGPHVHEARLQAARAAGCDRVLTRGQFHAHGVELLASYALQ